MRLIVAIVGLGTTVLACASNQPRSSDIPSQDLRTDASAFYESYGAALKAHRRDTLAQYYSPEGALIVFNGARMQLSRNGIDSVYRGRWQGPVFFSWDSMTYEVIRPRQVLVTGQFRWQPPGSADTSRYIYLSILEATDSGIRIRVEHETLMPRSR